MASSRVGIGSDQREAMGYRRACVWEGAGEALVAIGSRMPKRVGVEAGEVKSRCSRGSSTLFWCLGWEALQEFEQESNKAIFLDYFL